jgi:uncharacterized RDD family membrane protein YckC
MPYQVARATPVFATWGSRVGGHLINGLVAVLFELPAALSWFAVPKETKLCTVNDEVRLCKLPTGPGWGILVGLAAVGIVLYFVLYSRMVARTGQAWGHKVVGIRLVDANTGSNIGAGKAFLRFTVGHWIDGLVCYLGYLWPLWDQNKQTFSDKMFGTYSVRA